MTTALEESISDDEIEGRVRAMYAAVVPLLEDGDELAARRSSYAGRRHRSWRAPVTATASLVVVVGGFAVAALGDDATIVRDSSTAAPAEGTAIGIFPAGDAAAVVDADYDSPEAVVHAYLADRTQTSEVPFGTAVRATVHDARTIDDHRAIVSFGLETAGDGSDGHADTVRVTGADGATGWAVTQAFAVSLEVPAMRFAGGELVGALAGGPDPAVLGITDATSGETLREVELSLPPLTGQTTRPPGTPIGVEDLPASEVILRFWQVKIYDDDDRVAPVLGEFLIRDGQQLVTGSRVVSTPYYPDFPMFAGANVSALDALGNAETLIVADGDLTITASHDVGGHTYCVEVTDGRDPMRECWPLAMIAAGDARQYVGRVVYRIVPDGVTVSQGGDPVEVTDNIWYTLTADDGSIPRFEFTDGVATQVEGGSPSPPPESLASMPPSSGGLTAPPPADSANPDAPSVYPVVETTDPVAASFLTVPGGGQPFTEIAVGRVESGTVRDAVVFNVGPPAAVSPSDTFGTPVTVFGQAGTLIEGPNAGEGQLVVWGDDPRFVAIGRDPMAFLDAAERGVLDVTFPASSAPTVTVGALPDGYEVLVEPQAVAAPSGVIGMLQVGDNELFVSTRNSLAAMVVVGNVSEVDVNGTVGWTFPDETNTHDIAWQVDDNTFAYLKVNDGSSVEEALAFARSVEFVPAGEWMTRFNVGLPLFAPPTTLATPS